MNEFKNRVFGCAIVKAINANYNADFTHQPRTLPDGTVYATDKAFKYSIRHYLKDKFPDEKIFYYKRLNENLNPHSLDETYISLFGDYPKIKKQKMKIDQTKEKELYNKKLILENLLKCLDIRLFGATFAGETNISIHGPVQINHGINRFFVNGQISNDVYSEQIMSPFRNPGEEGSEQKGMTTLGQQSKLLEGHYIHHFSVNPQNLSEVKKLADNTSGLTNDDIIKLKEAMRFGVSYYDSTAKAGTDNELLLWVQMKKISKTVLPVFTEFITIFRENNKVIIDFNEINKILSKVFQEIERIEVYYIPENTLIKNLPKDTLHFDLITEKQIV